MADPLDYESRQQPREDRPAPVTRTVRLFRQALLIGGILFVVVLMRVAVHFLIYD